MVHKIPENLSLEEAAVVEPTAVVMHALSQSTFKAGMTAAVLVLDQLVYLLY